MKASIAAALALCGSLLLAGCGGGGGGGSSPPPDSVPLVWDQGNWDSVSWQ